MQKLLLVLSALPVTIAFAGCRGQTSTKPPVHINPNMDWQEKLKAQSESAFKGWKDERGMRLPVEGTVARGSLNSLDPDPEVAKLHIYKNPDGSYVTENPLPATPEVLARGKERYGIHCSVCHGLSGRGDGVVGRKFAVKPTPFHAKTEGDMPGANYKPTTLQYSDGEIFDVITTGKGTTMQPYRFQVDVRDRWAIIHYIRALQYRAAN